LSETPPLEDPQPLAEQETITEHKSAEPVQINEPTAVHPEVITPTEQADGEEDIILMGRNYLGDEEQTGNWGRTWLIVLLVIVALALAIFGLYKYNPSLFNRLLGNKSAVAALSTNATQKAASPEATDTSKEAAIAKNDTSTDAKTTAAPLNDQPVANDTLARKRYEILGGAFHTIKEANKTIDNYKRMGFDAHILKNVPGRLYKITLGTYFNIDEAINAENKLLKTGHVTTKQIGIQPYNPKINQKR
jgi:cell division septation protein DedD